MTSLAQTVKTVEMLGVNTSEIDLKTDVSGTIIEKAISIALKKNRPNKNKKIINQN